MKIIIYLFFKKILHSFFHWLKPRCVSGVDIGDTFIHVLALTTNKNPRCVLAYSTACLPENAVRFGVIQNIPALTTIIRNLLSNMPYMAARVVLAMPDCLILQTDITASKSLNRRQIESFVYMSAANNVCENMYVDFEILAHPTDRLLHHVRVYAAHARDVQQRVELLQLCGVKTHIMEIKSCAIVRALCCVLQQCQDDFRQKTIALIEFDQHHISFYVMHNMRLIFMDHKLYDPPSVTPVNEIDYLFQLFYASKHACDIAHVFLAGNYLNLAGMAHVLSAHLNLEVQIIQPLENFIFADDLLRASMTNKTSELLTVLGLALR